MSNLERGELENTELEAGVEISVYRMREVVRQLEAVVRRGNPKAWITINK